MPVFLFWLPGPKGQYSPAMDRPYAPLPVAGPSRAPQQGAAADRLCAWTREAPQPSSLPGTRPSAGRPMCWPGKRHEPRLNLTPTLRTGFCRPLRRLQRWALVPPGLAPPSERTGAGKGTAGGRAVEGDRLKALVRGDPPLALREHKRQSIRPEVPMLRSNCTPILRAGLRRGDVFHRASSLQLTLTGPVRRSVVYRTWWTLPTTHWESLAALPARILVDNGSYRSRPRRALARLQRIAEGRVLEDEDDEDGSGTPGSRRRRVPAQAKLVGRVERHASRGSIRRAAAALDAALLADTSDPAVMAKLRALHPEADAPAHLETDVQMSEETLEAVEKRLSAHSRGTAGGVTRWTCEQALVPVRVSCSSST